jgi:hypothetical protein
MRCRRWLLRLRPPAAAAVVLLTQLLARARVCHGWCANPVARSSPLVASHSLLWLWKTLACVMGGGGGISVRPLSLHGRHTVCPAELERAGRYPDPRARSKLRRCLQCAFKPVCVSLFALQCFPYGSLVCVCVLKNRSSPCKIM